jgi:hypothetical protein
MHRVMWHLLAKAGSSIRVCLTLLSHLSRLPSALPVTAYLLPELRMFVPALLTSTQLYSLVMFVHSGGMHKRYIRYVRIGKLTCSYNVLEILIAWFNTGRLRFSLTYSSFRRMLRGIVLRHYIILFVCGCELFYACTESDRDLSHTLQTRLFLHRCGT